MRKAEIKRKTKETNISISLNLDGSGKTSIETGIPFFDHMLSSFAKHSNIDLNLDTMGDLEVDFHHTIEKQMFILLSSTNCSNIATAGEVEEIVRIGVTITA